MRLVRWLDRLLERPWKRRAVARCGRSPDRAALSVQVEWLETRTQLTGLMFSATADAEIFELSVPQRGAVTLTVRNGDGSRFVGEVALLSPSGRVLREQQFAEESAAVLSTLTETVDQGTYLVRIRPTGSTSTATPQLELQLESTSDLGVGDEPISVLILSASIECSPHARG